MLKVCQQFVTRDRIHTAQLREAKQMLAGLPRQLAQLEALARGSGSRFFLAMLFHQLADFLVLRGLLHMHQYQQFETALVYFLKACSMMEDIALTNDYVLVA